MSELDVFIGELKEHGVCLSTRTHRFFCSVDMVDGGLGGDVVLPPVLPPPVPPEPAPPVEDLRPLMLGQCWDEWREVVYAPGGTLTYCQGGCLAMALASLIMWAGKLDPCVMQVVEKLGEVGCFVGDMLGRPGRVSGAYGFIRWHGRGDDVYWSPRYECGETSFIDWKGRAADMKLLRALLDQQPIVLEVDYKPKTRPVDQHFVLGWEYVPDASGGMEDDLIIMDPASGTYTSILTYFDPAWLTTGWMEREGITKVQRTVMGARVFEIVT